MLFWMELAIILRPVLLSSELQNYIKKRPIWTIFLLAGLSVCGIAASLKNLSTVFIMINQEGTYPLYLIAASSLIGVVYFASAWLSEHGFIRKGLSYLGKHTLVVLMFHKFPLLFFESILPATKYIFNGDNGSAKWLCSALITVFSICGCLAVEWLYNKALYLVKNRKSV